MVSANSFGNALGNSIVGAIETTDTTPHFQLDQSQVPGNSLNSYDQIQQNGAFLSPGGALSADELIGLNLSPLSADDLSTPSFVPQFGGANGVAISGAVLAGAPEASIGNAEGQGYIRGYGTLQDANTNAVLGDYTYYGDSPSLLAQADAGLAGFSNNVLDQLAYNGSVALQQGDTLGFIGNGLKFAYVSTFLPTSVEAVAAGLIGGAAGGAVLSKGSELATQFAPGISRAVGRFLSQDASAAIGSAAEKIGQIFPNGSASTFGPSLLQAGVLDFGAITGRDASAAGVEALASASESASAEAIAVNGAAGSDQVLSNAASQAKALAEAGAPYAAEVLIDVAPLNAAAIDSEASVQVSALTAEAVTNLAGVSADVSTEDLAPIVTRPSYQQSEVDVGNQLTGSYRPQVSFKNINGAVEEVPYGTTGSTRPDFYELGTSIEVKNYNLGTVAGQNRLVSNVTAQAAGRALNLPTGTIQRIFIDARGQSIDLGQLSNLARTIEARSNGILTTSNIEFLR